MLSLEVLSQFRCVIHNMAIKRLTRPFVSLPSGVNIFYDSIRAIRSYGTAVQILTTVDFNDITYVASSSAMADMMVQSILNGLSSGITQNTPLKDNTISTAIATPGNGFPYTNFVTITGTGLANSRFLVLGGDATLYDIISATDTTAISATTITSLGGTYDVTLLDSANNVIAFLPSGLTLIGPNLVSPLTLDFATANAGFTLDVYGAGFTNLGSEVLDLVNVYTYHAASITFISATHIQGNWAAGLGMAANPYQLNYYNPAVSALQNAFTITP